MALASTAESFLEEFNRAADTLPSSSWAVPRSGCRLSTSEPPVGNGGTGLADGANAVSWLTAGRWRTARPGRRTGHETHRSDDKRTALALAVTLVMAGAGSARAQDARNLTVEQVAFDAVQAPVGAPAANPLHVSAWVDHPDNTYAYGERLRLFVQTNKDAYVTVLNVGPDGGTTMLFPNRSVRTTGYGRTRLPRFPIRRCRQASR